MRILTVDTATRRGVVATVDGEKVVVSSDHEHPTQHAERLFAMIDHVLSASHWSKGDIELLVVGMGPGSFTGVRVGMAAAKGLAYSLDLPMVGVTSLAAMAHAGRIEVGPKPVIAMLDAKKGEVFVACYGRAGQLRKGPDHIPRERVQSWISDLCLDEELAVVGEVAGQLSVKNVAWIRTAGCELPGPASTAALAQAMWDDHHRNEIDTLEPLYVRPPDITRSKRMIL